MILLAPSYEAVFRPEELKVRDQIIALRNAAADDRVRDVLRRPVEGALRSFGVPKTP